MTSRHAKSDGTSRTNVPDVAALVQELTLDEKIFMLSGATPFWPGQKALLEQDSYHKTPFSAAYCERLGIPGVHFIDGPRGVVIEGGATSFPVSMARGASWDPELEARIGNAIGKELRAMGGTLFGGVCINLLRHPGWGRAQETYGEDPVLVGAMGAGLVRGVEQHAIACVKHFAANSMENARFNVDVSMDDRTLHEVYLPHFKECIDAGARAVMSAYNAVNGEWCGQSPTLLNDILKTRWGFRGFVLTDFIFGLRDAKTAIEAGLDLEMPFEMVWGQNLKDLVRRGDVEEHVLDAALERIIAPQFDMPPQDAYGVELVGAPEHRALAREAAAKSMVLLQNDGVLPLAEDAKIVVLGRLADTPNLGDRGSSDGRPDYVITPFAGLHQAGQDVVHFADANAPGAAEALDAADHVIVVVGYTHEDEGEFVTPKFTPDILSIIPFPKPLHWLSRSRVLSHLKQYVLTGVARVRERKMLRDATRGDSVFGLGGDRGDLGLRKSDEMLIDEAVARNPNVSVAVMGGSAILMEAWRSKVRAIMMIWYPGMEGGHAFADLMFGKTSPSGKLPLVIPTDPGHLPSFDINATKVVYDFWHGHRLLQRDGHTPAFPFGFGLSYSRFTHSNLQLSQNTARAGNIVSVTVDVTNAGAMAGDEVVQMYVSAKGSSVQRPLRELKGFARVSLDPGETQTVSISLPVDKLSYFDETSGDFVLEPLEYEISAACHADDPQPLRASLQIPL